jgi:hypothetical protein
MGRKKVAGTSDGQRDVEGLAIVFHVRTRPFQHRECGVTFITSGGSIVCISAVLVNVIRREKSIRTGWRYDS